MSRQPYGVDTLRRAARAQFGVHSSEHAAKRKCDCSACVRLPSPPKSVVRSAGGFTLSDPVDRLIAKADVVRIEAREVAATNRAIGVPITTLGRLFPAVDSTLTRSEWEQRERQRALS